MLVIQIWEYPPLRLQCNADCWTKRRLMEDPEQPEGQPQKKIKATDRSYSVLPTEIEYKEKKCGHTIIFKHQYVKFYIETHLDIYGQNGFSKRPIAQSF